MSTRADDVELIRASRQAWGRLETFHVLGYFADDVRDAFVALGLHPRLSYFAARSAAFGAVGPEVPTATFYVFAPWLLRKALPASWAVASPERVQQARRDAMSVVIERVVGDADVSELLDLTRTVCAGLTAPGRPLYAAHAGLAWPDEPRLALWHAATLIREHRGDGHVAALLRAGLDPVESIVIGGLFSGTTGFMRSSRGWSDEEWAAGVQRLTERGLLDGDTLTEDGLAFRMDLERETDRMALEGWAHLGLDDTRRIAELAAPLRSAALASGILPDWIGTRG
ncbi:SCO6745 family protein [Terrabacter sp. 2YAF2]|uniref:SCO6745 family protein n=1 Tax=Terrabacter sp. 2YAF2 TaxID=3233026 RepID=UPI003F96A8F2